MGDISPPLSQGDELVERIVSDLVKAGRAKKCSLGPEQRAAADDEAAAFYRKIVRHVRQSLTTDNASQAQRIAELEAALREIANPLDCGCRPCTGSCRSQVALECEVEARQEIARLALSKDTTNAG